MLETNENPTSDKVSLSLGTSHGVTFRQNFQALGALSQPLEDPRLRGWGGRSSISLRFDDLKWVFGFSGESLPLGLLWSSNSLCFFPIGTSFKIFFTSNLIFTYCLPPFSSISGLLVDFLHIFLYYSSYRWNYRLQSIWCIDRGGLFCSK